MTRSATQPTCDLSEYYRQLGPHMSINSIPPTLDPLPPAPSDPELAQAMEHVLSNLVQAYSKSTWKQRASIRVMFQDWCQKKNLPITREMVDVFVSAHQNIWASSTQKHYIRTLHHMFTMQNIPALHLKGLTRASAADDSKHALPLTPKDVALLLQQYPSVHDRTAIRLAWSTASRWGDFVQLRINFFNKRDDGKLEIDWNNIPKKSQEEKLRDDRFSLLSGTLALRVERLIQSKGREDPTALVFPKSTYLFLEALKTLGPRVDDSGKLRYFTLHSIKQGASQQAALLYRTYNIPKKALYRLMKHKKEETPKASHSYLGSMVLNILDNETLPSLLHGLIPSSSLP